jgi:hypothetical protein
MQEPRTPHISDMARLWSFIIVFEGLGLMLLVPIALALGLLSHSIVKPAYPLLVGVLGSAIGVILVLPISVGAPTFPDILLPVTCGAISALIWLAFNRDVVRR